MPMLLADCPYTHRKLATIDLVLTETRHAALAGCCWLSLYSHNEEEADAGACGLSLKDPAVFSAAGSQGSLGIPPGSASAPST